MDTTPGGEGLLELIATLIGLFVIAVVVIALTLLVTLVLLALWGIDRYRFRAVDRWNEDVVETALHKAMVNRMIADIEGREDDDGE